MKNRQVMAEMILAVILLSGQTMGKVFGSLSRSLLGKNFIYIDIFNLLISGTQSKLSLK